jgi:hypothetical protein
MKYRKKPVEIEAYQITTAAMRWRGQWPDWLHEAYDACIVRPSEDGDYALVIGTLEGAMQVSYNDFIIKGVIGELYPCKPEVFEATYEPSSNGQSEKTDSS